jgi:hypothetical protein
MNIACLGCSYTAGMPDDFSNWPEELAKLRPQDNIFNLAVAGSSLLFSLHILQEFKCHLTFDKIIFQITHPHRFTSIKNADMSLSMLTQNKNYYRLDPAIRTQGNIMTVTPGDITMKWSKVYEKIKFAKQYYRYHNNTLGNLEHNILKDVAKKSSHFSFERDEVPEQAKKHLLDDEVHFSLTGHKIIAEWINNELERSIY